MNTPCSNNEHEGLHREGQFIEGRYKEGERGEAATQNEKKPDEKPPSPSKKTKGKNSHKEPKSEPSKKAYGENQKVRLTDDQYAALVCEFGKELTEEYIKRMDTYLTDTGKYYSDCYEKLRKWMKEDEPKRETAKRQAENKPVIKRNAFYNFTGRKIDFKELERLEQEHIQRIVNGGKKEGGENLPKRRGIGWDEPSPAQGSSSP